VAPRVRRLVVMFCVAWLANSYGALLVPVWALSWCTFWTIYRR
jgi:hypothetical protein